MEKCTCGAVEMDTVPGLSICCRCRADRALEFFLGPIDWKLLHRQKESLVAELRAIQDNDLPVPTEMLQGLIHFIDAFQDHAVDALYIAEAEAKSTPEEGL